VVALALAGITVVGIATLSDALVLAWAATIGLLALGWWIGLVRTRRGLGRKAFASFGVPLLLLAAVVTAGPSIAEFLDERAVSGYSEGGQGSDRLARWRFGMEAIEASPIVGLGPGSFSGPVAPFRGEEAHNSVIDWGMSTGLVGALAYLALLALIVRRCVAARDVLGLAGIVALFVFTTFHYAFRQPAFWMQLVLLAAPHGRSLVARPRPRARLHPVLAEG
jgi:O-antigen ligase